LIVGDKLPIGALKPSVLLVRELTQPFRRMPAESSQDIFEGCRLMLIKQRLVQRRLRSNHIADVLAELGLFMFDHTRHRSMAQQEPELVRRWSVRQASVRDSCDGNAKVPKMLEISQPQEFRKFGFHKVLHTRRKPRDCRGETEYVKPPPPVVYVGLLVGKLAGDIRQGPLRPFLFKDLLRFTPETFSLTGS